MTKQVETTLIKLVIELASNGYLYGDRFHKDILVLLSGLKKVGK